jgi:branched-chain amino acid transport system substrate-binding protein
MLTGPQADTGREAFRGIEIAADMVNDMGGLWSKRKITLVTGDASDSEAARTETERLCTVEKVKLIVGGYASSLAFVEHPIAHKHGVVFWETNAVADRLRQLGHKYCFFFGPQATIYGAYAAQSLVDVVCPKLGKRPQDLRIAVIYQGTEWGKSISYMGFIQKAKEFGMKIIMDEPYDPKTVDFTSLVLKIKAANPDVVSTQNYIDDGFRFYRDAIKNGLNPKVWLMDGCPWANVAEAFEKFGDDMNYILDVNQVAGGNLWVLSPVTQSQYRELSSRYLKKYGREMIASGEVAVGFTAAIALFEYVLPAAGSLDPEKISQAAHDISLPYTATARPGEGIKFSSANAEFANQNIRAGAQVRQIFNKTYYTVWPKRSAEIDPILPLPPFGKKAIKESQVEKQFVIPKDLHVR